MAEHLPHTHKVLGAMFNTAEGGKKGEEEGRRGGTEERREGGEREGRKWASGNPSIFTAL